MTSTGLRVILSMCWRCGTRDGERVRPSRRYDGPLRAAAADERQIHPVAGHSPLELEGRPWSGAFRSVDAPGRPARQPVRRLPPVAALSAIRPVPGAATRKCGGLHRMALGWADGAVLYLRGVPQPPRRVRLETFPVAGCEAIGPHARLLSPPATVRRVNESIPPFRVRDPHGGRVPFEPLAGKSLGKAAKQKRLGDGAL